MALIFDSYGDLRADLRENVQHFTAYLPATLIILDGLALVGEGVPPSGKARRLPTQELVPAADLVRRNAGFPGSLPAPPGAYPPE